MRRVVTPLYHAANAIFSTCCLLFCHDGRWYDWRLHTLYYFEMILPPLYYVTLIYTTPLSGFSIWSFMHGMAFIYIPKISHIEMMIVSRFHLPPLDEGDIESAYVVSMLDIILPALTPFCRDDIFHATTDEAKWMHIFFMLNYNICTTARLPDLSAFSGMLSTTGWWMDDG